MLFEISADVIVVVFAIVDVDVATATDVVEVVSAATADAGVVVYDIVAADVASVTTAVVYVAVDETLDDALCHYKILHPFQSLDLIHPSKRTAKFSSGF